MRRSSVYAKSVFQQVFYAIAMGSCACCGVHSAKPGCISPDTKIQGRPDLEQIGLAFGFLRHQR